MQILGENVKNKKKDGTLIYKLGVIYFDSCTRDKTKFKKMSEWWLIDVGDVVCRLEPPVVEKISGQRVMYTFNLEEPKEDIKDKKMKDA